MEDRLIRRARLLLRQAWELREQVRENLRKVDFPEDDVQGKAYNDLIQEASYLFPTDPVLNGGMVIMPDANLQRYKMFGIVLPPDLPSRRLEVHLTRLVNRLELRLGEAARPASEVLSEQTDQEVRTILDTLERLRRDRAPTPQLEYRDFSFVTDPQLRQVLKQDFIEAQRAFAVGAFKASSLLSGGLIEGMLLDALQRPNVVAQPEYQEAVAKLPRKDSSINWDYVSLTQLIHAAQHLWVIEEGAARLAEGARDFRDTVHPNAELREGIRAQSEEAKLLLVVVELIYRGLAKQA